MTKAAGLVGVAPNRLQGVLSPSEGKFWSYLPDGSVRLTPMGEGFADRVSTFPRVNW